MEREIKKYIFSGWGNSTVGRLFVLHASNPSWTPGTPFGPLNLPGEVFEHRARTSPKLNWAWHQIIFRKNVFSLFCFLSLQMKKTSRIYVFEKI